MDSVYFDLDTPYGLAEFLVWLKEGDHYCQKLVCLEISGKETKIKIEDQREGSHW